MFKLRPTVRPFIRLCAVGLFAFYGSATAQSDRAETATPSNEPQWQVETYALVFSGNLPSKEQRAKTYTVEAIYTDNKETPGAVAFTCVAGKMSLAIATKPKDFEAFIRNNTKSQSSRTRKVPLYINGDRQILENWTYVSKTDILMPRTQIERNKVYNAVLRQDKVEIDMDFKDRFSLVLPKPNDAFNDFGKDCGIGRLSNL